MWNQCSRARNGRRSPSLSSVGRYKGNLQYSVAGKAADAFDEHQINLPGVAVRNQPLELRPIRGTCACDSFICVHTCVLPFRILLDEGAVVTDLRRKRVVKRIHRNTGVCRHTQLRLERGILRFELMNLQGNPSFPLPYSRTIRTIASQYLKIEAR